MIKTTHRSAERAVEARLRRDLAIIAATATADGAASPVTTAAPQPAPGRSRSRKRRLAWGIGAACIPVAVAAGAYVQSGPEYVDQIPRDTILTEGSVGGDRYLLVETRRTECGKPATGVELVEEDENLIGSEWNTMGQTYGESTECGADPTAYLEDPARYNHGGTIVGDSFVWLWAVHPDVTAVRITSDDFTKDLPIYSVDGAGYALFEIPKGMTEYTSELLIDDAVVPGSVEDVTVPAGR